MLSSSLRIQKATIRTATTGEHTASHEHVARHEPILQVLFVLSARFQPPGLLLVLPEKLGRCRFVQLCAVPS